MKFYQTKARLLTVFLLLSVLGIWQIATSPTQVIAPNDPIALEYEILMGNIPEHTAKGAIVSVQQSDFPSPKVFAQTAAAHLSDPFYDKGTNDKGIGIQLGYSLMRVLSGFVLAVLVAIPFGYLLGVSAVFYKAVSPFVQLLKPISPLAWMPLALYTIKDASLSAVFVIFICSVWPMLTNTAFGVASVRRDWLNVARTLELGFVKTASKIVLPAAAPTIVTGMRISMGIAWLVIVAAEMIVGSTGIGYFVWNAWNNLSLANVIFAIVIIGVVGMVLDWLFAVLQKKISYIQ